jgi:penicillin V acylase-like amidase (Ntn superfamily)
MAGELSGERTVGLRSSAGKGAVSLSFVLVLLSCFRVAVDACTVFFAFDGRTAIAGQNEDWDDSNTHFWVVPRTATTHGVLYFGFGRGEYPKDGIAFSPRVQEVLQGKIDQLDALTPEDLYGIPQQGVNEKGLFFGGAQTETVEQPARPGRLKYEGAIVDLILRRGATVVEALEMLQTYEYVMPAGQLLFADKSGDSFILEAGHVIAKKAGRHQVMTNFLQSREPEKRETDRRYTLVDSRLRQEQKLSVDLAVSLLSSVQQSNTQYSLVFNLTDGRVFVYRSRRFDEGVELVVGAEVAKGPRAGRIRSLFDNRTR